MSFFKGKNILILSVKFFNYENLIKQKLVDNGAKVDLFDERPSNSFLSKAIIRLKRGMYQRRIHSHYKKIIDSIQNENYDYFLLIKGEVVPIFFLKFLRSNNPNIELIYYTFDSFKNNPNGLSVLPFFDRKFTFDLEDARKYKLSFRPLFFASVYDQMKNQKEELFDYDLSFIGTVHSDRYNISHQLEKLCNQFGLKMFNFYFSPSKILFYYKSLTDKSYMKFDLKMISFKSLKHSQINDIYIRSRAILDINHPGQSGLTMRTFETLGSGRKLVTTNHFVKLYPFYNENNILVIDRDNPKLDYSFFEKDFQEIDESVNYSMSLEGWLNELFYFQSDIWSL